VQGPHELRCGTEILAVQAYLGDQLEGLSEPSRVRHGVGHAVGERERGHDAEYPGHRPDLGGPHRNG
jgi:hypothetical protein